MKQARALWPCTWVEATAESPNHSIIFTAFERLEGELRGDGGGYSVEAFVKREAKARDPGLLKRVCFDPEASMFCAYGADRAALEAIAKVLHDACGGAAAEKRAKPRTTALPADPAAVERALLAGFVEGLDPKAQQTFARLVPEPPHSLETKKLVASLTSRTAAERHAAARRMGATARSHTRNAGHYLSDPRVSEALMKALGKETDPKAKAEMISALAFVCVRHLPDLRALPYFELALSDPRRPIRLAAIIGVTSLYRCPWEKLLPLLDDRVVPIRLAVFRHIHASARFPIWMFTTERPCPEAGFPPKLAPALVKKLADGDWQVRSAAFTALCRLAIPSTRAALTRAMNAEKHAGTKADMRWRLGLK